MGSAESQLTTLKNGFDEVATKCKWKKGLIVDVRNQGQFLVVGIYSVRSQYPPEALYIEERPDGIIYVYSYTGNQIISNNENSGLFTIELKPIANAKIGGFSRAHTTPKTEDLPSELPKNTADEPSESEESEDIIIDEEPPNFTTDKEHNKKLTVKCRPCSHGIIGACDLCGKKQKSHANGRAPTSILNDDDDYFPDDNIADIDD